MAQAIASSRPMGSVFWPVVGRFVWKELRATVGLALGAVGILVALLLLFRWSLWSGGGRINPATAEVFFIAAGIVSALYAVAATITAFSAEKELKTHTLLFQIPHHWLAMGLGKLLAISGSALVVSVVLGSMAIAFAGGVLPDDLDILVRHLGVFLIEAIAWSLLVSLICPQPLIGAVIACAMVGMGPYIVTDFLFPGQYIQGPELYAAIPYRLALAGVLMVLNVALVRRWIAQSPERAGGGRRLFGGWSGAMATEMVMNLRQPLARGQVRRPSLAGLKLLDVSPYEWRTPFARLVWHAWRLAWGRMLGLIAAGGALIVFFYVMLPETADARVLVPLAVGVVILPSLFGAVAFGADQRQGRYEFLAQHGAPRGGVWLSRLVIWLAPVLVGLLMLLLLVWPEVREDTHSHFHWAYLFIAVLLTALTAFALGQVASLWVKSEIRAAGLAFVFMVVLPAWAVVSLYWRISPWWSLLPIAVGALLATRIDIHAWMNNRRDRASWGRSVAAALVPMAIVVGSVPLVRNWQIEWALRQVPAEHVAAIHAERDALASRREADARVTARYEALSQLHQQGWFTDDEMAEMRELTTENVFRTRRLVHMGTARSLASAQRQKIHAEQNLDRAWENYLALYRFRGQMLQEIWAGEIDEDINPELELAILDYATRPGQSAERLEAAIDDLRQADAAYPPRDRWLMTQYVDALEALESGVALWDRTPNFLHYLPGEKSRVRKAFDVLAAATRDSTDKVLQSDRILGLDWHQTAEPSSFLRPQYLSAWRAAMSSPAADLWWRNHWTYTREAAAAEEEAARRGLEKVRLALMAFHLRHGKYPESLDELPMDVSTLLPDWWPKLVDALEYEPQGYRLQVENKFAPHTPLLWIGGPYAFLAKESIPTRDPKEDANGIPIEEDEDVPRIEVLDITSRLPNLYVNVVVPLPRSEDYPNPAKD